VNLFKLKYFSTLLNSVVLFVVYTENKHSAMVDKGAEENENCYGKLYLLVSLSRKCAFRNP
jgi:hypothetical protein